LSGSVIASDYIAVIKDCKTGNLIESHSTGKVKTLAYNIGNCTFSPSGQYVFSQSNNWFVGSILNTDTPSAIILTNIPIGAYNGMPSNDGNLIAWLGKESGSNSISIYSCKMQTRKLFSIYTSGTYGALSWSPDDTQLAYYYKDSKSYIRNNYSLCLLSLIDGGSLNQEIAPPSLPLLQVNPSRNDPPEWSPSGESILFEAHYTNDTSMVYLMSLNGHKYSAVKTDSEETNHVDYLVKVKEPVINANVIINSDSLIKRFVPIPNNYFCVYSKTWGDLVALASLRTKQLCVLDTATMKTYEMCSFSWMGDKVLWCGQK